MIKVEFNIWTWKNCKKWTVIIIACIVVWLIDNRGLTSGLAGAGIYAIVNHNWD